MKYPFFASFIILALTIRHLMRHNRNRSEKEEKTFWEIENEANSTRRKSLDDLEYIRIDFDALPTERLPEDETIKSCLDTLHVLDEEKIVNLTGYTNTQLKLKYGAPNITLLSKYDENYTLLVQTLQKWANYLWEKGLVPESIQIMEFEASIRADVGTVYKRLASHYRKNGQPEKVEDLKKIVESLDSMSKKSILRSLEEEA